MIKTHECYVGDCNNCNPEFPLTTDPHGNTIWGFCGCRCHEHKWPKVGTWINEVEKKNE